MAIASAAAGTTGKRGLTHDMDDDLSSAGSDGVAQTILGERSDGYLRGRHGLEQGFVR